MDPPTHTTHTTLPPPPPSSTTFLLPHPRPQPPPSSDLFSPEELTHLTKLANQAQTSKYAQLLGVIEEMGRDIRPTYAGSKSSSERLKRSIVHARILVRECLMETEKSGRQ